MSGAFLGSLEWVPTANQRIAIPDDTGTVLLDDRPIGTLNSGVVVRGYAPLILITGDKTLALSDAGTNQLINAASTITIPNNSAVAYPIGTVITITRNSSSIPALLEGSGVTITNELGATITLRNVLNSAILTKTLVNTWRCQYPIPSGAVLPVDAIASAQSLGDRSTKVANTNFVQDNIDYRLTNIARPALEVYRLAATSVQTFASGLTTTLIFDYVQLDTDSGYNSSSGNFLVPTGMGGIYLYNVYVGLSTPGSSVRINLVKNGSIIESNRGQKFIFTTDVQYSIANSGQVRLNSGDILRFDVSYTSASGASSTTTTTNIPRLFMSRLYA